MQAGTTTDNCGENCPWRTTAKRGDLISRAAALDALDHERKVLIEQERFGAEHIVVHHAQRLIEDLPAVDAVPVVHGEWKWSHGGQCSECGFHNSNFDYNYCPNCGAKMRENE